MHLRSVIKQLQTWIAALFLGLILTGCGGGSEQGSQSSDTSGQTAAADRSASLSWNAPLKRQNGDALKMGQLAGYVISYGQSPDELSETVRISDANTMQYTVTNLEDGTWFFTVQVEDIDGLISAPSAQVSKTI